MYDTWVTDILHVGGKKSPLKDRACSNCRSREFKTWWCGLCHNAATPGLQVPRYCSDACQRNDWQVHRRVCTYLKPASERIQKSKDQEQKKSSLGLNRFEFEYMGQLKEQPVAVKNVCSICRSRKWKTYSCEPCKDAATPSLQVPRYCGRACQRKDRGHHLFCASLWTMTQI
jgi:hypothetical protein